MEKRKIVEIEVGKKIKYDCLHKSYGRAEFEFCAHFKYGKITDLWIIPRQQDDIKIYHLKVSKDSDRKGLYPYSWISKGIESPKMWNSYWCKEHKAHCLRFYVPNNTNTLTIDYSLENIDLRFDEETSN